VLVQLKEVPIFTGVKEEALERLAGHGHDVHAKAGELIVKEGDPGNSFFLIATGAVRVFKNFGHPHELALARMDPGSFFGEMCILETLPRSATVQAIEDSTLFNINSLAFLDLYESMPGEHSILVLNIARDLSRRIRHLDDVLAAKL
jgi:CRP-like cAMP-binding protein